MENNNRLSNLEWIFERQLYWIAASEIKTAAIITVAIGMLGALASAFTLNTSHSCIAQMLSIGVASLLILSLIFAGMVILPRLDGPVNSLLFFGSISKSSRKGYVSKLISCTDDDLITDFANQIHRNAEVAQIKHQWAARALLTVFLTAIPWVITLIALTNSK